METQACFQITPGAVLFLYGITIAGVVPCEGNKSLPVYHP